MDIDFLLKKLEDYKSRVISDAILFNQIPTPSYHEELRSEFIVNRLREFGISKIDVDQAGNVIVKFPGDIAREEAVLLFTHLDNYNYSPEQRIVTVDTKRAYGMGIGDNSLGVSSLLVLAEFFNKYSVSFKHNVILLFTAGSRPEKDFPGIKFFLQNLDFKITYAIEINGVSVNKIGHKAVGKYQYQVTLKTKGGNAWKNSDQSSAIEYLSRLNARLHYIGWPPYPKTRINVFRLYGRSEPNTLISEAIMDLEIMSEDDEFLEFAKKIFFGTINKSFDSLHADINIRQISFIPPGEIPKYHFLVKTALDIHEKLGIKSELDLIKDESSILLSYGIPVISLGITTGERSLLDTEYVDLEPINNGLKQIFMVIAETMKHLD